MQKFLVVVLMVVCLVGEVSAASANGPKLNFSAQGQSMAGLEVEILGLGIKGRTDSAGNFDCSALNERILQKKMSTNLSEKIRVLVKTLQDVPTQVIEFPMSELTSIQIKRIELKKSSTVREQANVLKVVGPSLRNYGGELIMSGVEILVLGDHSRDTVQDGLISLTPYIDDQDHSFTMVLIGQGYETKFVNVNIPRHKRGEEVFQAAKGDLTLKPDFFKPIELVLTAPPQLNLDYPVQTKKVEYFQDKDLFIVRVVLTTESQRQYFGGFAFPKEQAGIYPLQERQELPISESPSRGLALVPLNDLQGVPNFVLTKDSFRSLKVAQPALPQAQSELKTKEGLSFGTKVFLVCLVIFGLVIISLAYEALRIRKEARRAEAEKFLRESYIAAGINFLDEIDLTLASMKKAMPLALTQGIAQLLEDAGEVVQNLLRNGVKINADKNRLVGVLKRLNDFLQRLLRTMRQYLEARQYGQAKTVQGQILSLEAEIKKVEEAKASLEESLETNNQKLREAVSFLRSFILKIELQKELERLKAEVPQALQDFMGALPVDRAAALDVDALVEALKSNKDLESALREVEGEEKVTELAEVDQLAKFLEDREGGGRPN